MSFGAPDAPDPTATANAQRQYNIGAAQDQNKTNSYNQTTPYGSLNYVADPNSPSGYRIDASLSPVQQNLLDTRQATQGQAGQAARTLFDNSAGMYSHPFNVNGSAVTDKLNQWQGQYLKPIFDQQGSNLEAQLRNQGLQPGSEAYNNAKNLLARNQGDITTNYLTKNQQQGFDQSLTEYQMPLSTVGQLMNVGAPQAPSFAATPTSQVQPANYSGLVEQQYGQQMQNYENNVNSVAKIGTAAIGLAGAPFTGGLSLGMMGGMFGGAPTSGGWGSTKNGMGFGNGGLY